MFVYYVIFQAEFKKVTGKPLVLCLRRKVYTVLVICGPSSVAAGISLNFTTFDLRWWQVIIMIMSMDFLWVMSSLFIFTCCGIIDTAKVIGDELAQVWTSHVINTNICMYFLFPYSTAHSTKFM
jgi:hypothetical protein